jgi:hypothetical protein
VGDAVPLELKHNLDTDVHVIKFGINYKWNWGWGKGPVAVAAKY